MGITIRWFTLQENGVAFVINGATQYFRGTVTLISADNPASTVLGGFKQSPSAFRCCRHCMGSEEDIQSKVYVCSYTTAMYMYYRYICILTHFPL